MSIPSESNPGLEYFQILRRGGLMIVVPVPEIEQLPSNVIDTAAQVVLAPLKANPSMNVVFDLSKVGFFGSEFISFLLRCHVIVKKHHCEMVLAGVADRIRELLRQTALDTLWAIYDNRTQAVEALGGSRIMVASPRAERSPESAADESCRTKSRYRSARSRRYRFTSGSRMETPDHRRFRPADEGNRR